ncbi:MAG: hypothetical protein NVSMB22_00130 [Chloroflexota bacterium]
MATKILRPLPDDPLGGMDLPARDPALEATSVAVAQARRFPNSLTVIGIALVLFSFVTFGWPQLHVDTWAAVGTVRALADRPIAGFGVGTVPKLGQLLLLAPGALGGIGWTKIWVALVGIAGVGSFAVSQRKAISVCAGHSLGAWSTAFVVMSPLFWRGSVDGGVTGWSWSMVLFAVGSLVRGRQRTAVALLALASVIRPEAVGAAMGIAVVEGWTGVHCSAGRARWVSLWLVVPSLIVALTSIVIVDLAWTGRWGSSMEAHTAFIHGYAPFRPPIRVVLFQNAGTVLFGVGGAASILGVIRAWHWTRNADLADTTSRHTGFLLYAAILGWLLVVGLNVYVGGPLFDRFLVPLVTAGTVPAGVAAAQIWTRAKIGSRSVLVLLLIVSTMASWATYFGRFAGKGPQRAHQYLEAAAYITATFPSTSTVGADQFIRAIAVGSGLRPWKTTWVLGDPAFNPCGASAIVSRTFQTPPPGVARLAQCGDIWLTDVEAIPGVVVRRHRPS